MHTSSITVLTSCRLELVLNPVPMQVMPSQPMILHSTECLSDGNRNYTIYGRSLVACYPELVGEQ